MLNRRKLALLLGTVAISAPALVACGFDAATDRPYTPAAGVSDQTQSVDVLGAVVVSTNPGSGTFIASLSNEQQGEDVELTSLSPAGGATIEATAFSPVTVPPGGLVNFADGGGLEVTGDFEAGDFVDITLGFGSGQRITMAVPVVANAGDFAGLDGPAPDPEPSETPEPGAEEAAE